MKLFHLDNICYFQNNFKILKNINLDINKSGLSVITGPNGSGKTTLLKLIFGLIEPTSGRLYKYDLSYKQLSFVFQNPVFLNRSFFYNIEHALYCSGKSKHERIKIINRLIDEYELQHLKDKNIHKLSGGELQILSLLRSVALNPKVLFYDEPSNNLDRRNLMRVSSIITSLLSKDITIIMVTHDDKFIQDLNYDYTNIILNQGKTINEM